MPLLVLPFSCRDLTQVSKEEQLCRVSASSSTSFGSSVHDWWTPASHQQEQVNGTSELLVSNATQGGTFTTPPVLTNLGSCECDCSEWNGAELKHLYRSPYNCGKCRTDVFALICNVKHLINNLNILQILSLIDSIWIVFYKLSGLKFKHIKVP